MKLIVLAAVYVALDYQPDRLIFHVSTSFSDLPRLRERNHLILMQKGDSISFQNTALGDYPYDTLAITYPQYFRLEKEDGDEVQNGVD